MPVSPPFEPVKTRFSLSQFLGIDRIFGIDVRTLALFRVALALLLLDDLRVRAIDLGAFYTDAGVLPRSACVELYSGLPGLWSLHLMSGLMGVQAILFLIAAGCALCLLLGYRTRWFTFLSWLMLVSLHNRNPMVLHGGDVVLRMLVFWGVFLPLGKIWSLDRLLATDKSAVEEASLPPEHSATLRVLSMGTLAALLQMCFVYWFAFALKTDPSWRSDGTALFYALSIDQLVKPLGIAMLGHPALLSFLTSLTMWIERFGPILALLPWWRVRLLMVAVFIGFHISMGLCLTLGLFPYAAIIGWLLFIPSEFWEIVARRYQALSPGAFKARVETIQAKISSWEQKLVILRSDFRPSPLQILAPRVASFLQWGTTSGLQGLAVFFLFYIFVWNLRSVNFDSYSSVFPPSVNWIGEATRTDQRWDMFAPTPLREDGWYVVPARVVNVSDAQDKGRLVDLYRDGAPLNWAKPALLSSTYKDERWQKYTLNLYSGDNSAHRSYYAAYLARQWNDSHPGERVSNMEIDYMREDSVLNAKYVKPQKVVLWTQMPGGVTK